MFGRLRTVVADNQCNRQANEEDMDHKIRRGRERGRLEMWRGRKGQDDFAHEEIERRTIKSTKERRPAQENSYPSARQVVDSRRGKSDEEMKS